MVQGCGTPGGMVNGAAGDCSEIGVEQHRGRHVPLIENLRRRSGVTMAGPAPHAGREWSSRRWVITGARHQGITTRGVVVQGDLECRKSPRCRLLVDRVPSRWD